MKFWQLVSVCNELGVEMDQIELGTEADELLSWYRDFDAIVDRQDRSILDKLIPDELCQQIIDNSNSNLYVSNDYLRKRPLADSDAPISAGEVVRRYGGAKLEEALESGLVSIEN